MIHVLEAGESCPPAAADPDSSAESEIDWESSSVLEGASEPACASESRYSSDADTGHRRTVPVNVHSELEIDVAGYLEGDIDEPVFVHEPLTMAASTSENAQSGSGAATVTPGAAQVPSLFTVTGFVFALIPCIPLPAIIVTCYCSVLSMSSCSVNQKLTCGHVIRSS